MKSVGCLMLAAVLAITAVAFSAPSFAGDHRMPMTSGGQTVAAGTPVLTPFPKKWWADD